MAAQLKQVSFCLLWAFHCSAAVLMGLLIDGREKVARASRKYPEELRERASERAVRPWRHLHTGFIKTYGTIVDDVGLGDGFARAIAPCNPEQAQRQIYTAELLAIL